MKHNKIKLQAGINKKILKAELKINLARFYILFLENFKDILVEKLYADSQIELCLFQKFHSEMRGKTFCVTCII